MENPILKVGLVGDYNEGVPAHQAIPRAIELAAADLAVSVQHQWIPTEEIVSAAHFVGFDALWCVPASPYRSMDGALTAIRFARESKLPFLGTCGGFQHAVIEYARNVLGWSDADHAETASHGSRLVISALGCSLVEKSAAVYLFPGSRIAGAYGASDISEGYRCNYGLNPDFRVLLEGGSLRACAEDNGGEVRAVELVDHPFFVATLFQPERAALIGKIPPLVRAFIEATRISTRRSVA